ncbi:MAG TPA: twin transmembrane helix small protein [Rhizomicrobium sp.]|jgi:hypothetical protein
MFGKIIVGIALAVVALTLFAGISTLWMGDQASRKWSNRLMRYRVLAQFVAIMIVLAVLYFSSPH